MRRYDSATAPSGRPASSRVGAVPAADEAFEPVEVGHLARRDCATPSSLRSNVVADVDEDVRRVRVGQVHLGHRPRLVALRRAARGARTGCARRDTPRHIVASPAARWSGWLAYMRTKLRSGDWPTTRCGRNRRITRLMSRRRRDGGLEPAVGVPEERDVGDADDLGRGPLLGLADLRHRRRAGSRRSKPPASPLVQMQYDTSMPASVHRATDRRRRRSRRRRGAR